MGNPGFSPKKIDNNGIRLVFIGRSVTNLEVMHMSHNITFIDYYLGRVVWNSLLVSVLCGNIGGGVGVRSNLGDQITDYHGDWGSRPGAAY